MEEYMWIGTYEVAVNVSVHKPPDMPVLVCCNPYLDKTHHRKICVSSAKGILVTGSLQECLRGCGV